jgi:signal transduction histidine kinase
MAVHFPDAAQVNAQNTEDFTLRCRRAFGSRCGWPEGNTAPAQRVLLTTLTARAQAPYGGSPRAAWEAERRRNLPMADALLTELGRLRGPEMATELNSHFLAVVVHDMRTPLNVIGLTLRLIDQAIPTRNSELDEDLRVVRENVGHIELMLAHLSDYCRLVEDSAAVRPSPFDLRRLAAELVEDPTARPLALSQQRSVRLNVAADCPQEVELDPAWARVAMRHAIGNALAAAEGGPVSLSLRPAPHSADDSERVLVEVAIEKPPPQLLQSLPLDGRECERLTGSPHERRGLDLAIAARVSEMFGGRARLEVVEGQRSVVVLDWPVRFGS